MIIDSNDAETGLTKEKWCSFKNDSNLVNDDTKLEIFRLTYFGGVQHDIRKEVWNKNMLDIWMCHSLHFLFLGLAIFIRAL